MRIMRLRHRRQAAEAEGCHLVEAEDFPLVEAEEEGEDSSFRSSHSNAPLNSFPPQQYSRTFSTFRLLRQSTSSNHRVCSANSSCGAGGGGGCG